MKQINGLPFLHALHGVRLEACERLLKVSFTQQHQALSNAVYNGGMKTAGQLLNIKVPEQADRETLEPPSATFAKIEAQLGLQGTTVGMMTAASMNSARIATSEVEREKLAVVVTSGISNARRAGDQAEFRKLDEFENQVKNTGTINTIILVTAQLTEAAMAEVMMVATEAKAALLQELGVYSPVSGKLATGTGTDALAVVSGNGPRRVHYAGKHTLLGEVVANTVMAATSDSLQFGRDRVANSKALSCG